MCHTPRKEYYKKFLYEAFPVESHLDHSLADHMNAEIVSRNVTSQQAAMDFLTWTFYYRRARPEPQLLQHAGALLHASSWCHFHQNISAWRVQRCISQCAQSAAMMPAWSSLYRALNVSKSALQAMT